MFIEGLKLEIRCEVKARQLYTLRVVISFARIHDKWLNNDAQRTKIMNRPVTIKPLSSPTTNRTFQPKELTQEELCDRSATGLCWLCNKLWSHNHHCKKGKLLKIDPIEELEREEEGLEHEEENMMVDMQLVDCTTHAPAGYANMQTINVVGFLTQQPITIPNETRSINNFMNSKVAAQLMLQNEDCSRVDVKVADSRILKCDRRCPRVKLLLHD
ncbi:hypothetical protein B296_00052243 [Ensete ventricosum]|uniref:Uncharacterized protein n=1 Tax=Ensete ventricosum TaxID=4639 RepID=A0A426XQS7_ENSVE|nr:hypothetical protein B296_00052243 [Ensete ventricosum]